jgi:response regulator RpfG family c-di-GMP phosphodiesterase
VARSARAVRAGPGPGGWRALRSCFEKRELPFRLRARPDGGFRRRGHIVVAILLVLVLVGIAPLATISWKLIGWNRETLTREKQEYQVLLASSMASELDLHVEGLGSELLRVAQTLGAAVRRRGTIPIDEIQRVLNEVTDSRVAYIRYQYFEGNHVKAVSAGEHYDVLEPLFDATLRQAAEHYAREAGSDTIFSDPLLVGAGHPLIAIAAPVRASGSFRGVLTAVVDLEQLWTIVTLRKTKGHLLFAIDGTGKVFATSDPDVVRPGSSQPDWDIVRTYLGSGRAAAGQSLPFEIDAGGRRERYIGTYEVSRLGWGIFVQARDDELLWVVGDMERETMTWLVLLLSAAMLAAVVFARTLSNPINRLAAASRALAAGEFSARVHVRARNEIGELAHTFNSMAERIESYIRRLKQAFEENNELFLGTIRALAQAIDAKDPYTRGHSVRVNRYSMIIARELGLSEDELRDLHVSSLLHDVGKIGIDDAILKKNGQLTREEYEIIKTHAALGATIMSPIRQMERVIPGLRYHHERCDGRGYPDGLKRDAIPRMARIIAVADTFDAITTVRPYQQPMTFEQAVARINALSGDSLDTEVVDAFNRACANGLLDPGSMAARQDLPIPAPPLPLDVEPEPLHAGAEAPAG